MWEVSIEILVIVNNLRKHLCGWAKVCCIIPNRQSQIPLAVYKLDYIEYILVQRGSKTMVTCHSDDNIHMV